MLVNFFLPANFIFLACSSVVVVVYSVIRRNCYCDIISRKL